MGELHLELFEQYEEQFFRFIAREAPRSKERGQLLDAFADVNGLKASVVASILGPRTTKVIPLLAMAVVAGEMVGGGAPMGEMQEFVSQAIAGKVDPRDKLTTLMALFAPSLIKSIAAIEEIFRTIEDNKTKVAVVGSFLPVCLAAGYEVAKANAGRSQCSTTM